jgi:hypothetical protein
VNPQTTTLVLAPPAGKEPGWEERQELIKYRVLPKMGLRLKHAELLEDLFNTWPSFHDSEITSIALDRQGPTITICLLVGMPQQSHNTYVNEYPSLRVTLEFYDVDDVVINNFNHQNVVAALVLSTADDTRFATGLMETRMLVTVESVFGAVCKFTSAWGEVMLAEPSELPLGSPVAPRPGAREEGKN